MKDITLTKGNLEDRIRYFLDELYTCGRVWEAWSYGTMTEDDFTNCAEDEDIVNDFKTLIATEQKHQLEKIRTGLKDKAHSRKCFDWNQTGSNEFVEAQEFRKQGYDSALREITTLLQQLEESIDV